MDTTFYSIHDYYISHHGTKGQKWGVRRYQNPDGTLTKAGMERYRKSLDPSRPEKAFQRTMGAASEFLDKKVSDIQPVRAEDGEITAWSYAKKSNNP